MNSNTQNKKMQEALGRKTAGPIELNPDAPLFALLIRKEDIEMVFNAIYAAVYRSVGVDVQREPFGYLAQKGMTASEMKHRSKICIEWIKEARAARGYSVQKAVDLMPQILRCKLDGIDWDPDSSSISLWAPT